MDKFKAQVTEEGFQTFLDISVELTGFSCEDLLATGMIEQYYYTIMKEPDPDLVRVFFLTCQSILDECHKQQKKLLKRITAELMPIEAHNNLARRIIRLWYTGIWEFTQGEGKKPISRIVSAEAFTQGLVWSAGETHAAGARQPGFASWSNPPLK